MEYACNFSKELLELLKGDEHLCDYIKIGDFGDTRKYMEEAFSLKPLLIHGFGWFERGGMPNTDIMDFDYMTSRLSGFKTPVLGMHGIAFKKDIIESENTFRHMVSIFKEIDSKIPCELIIENMDYTHAYTYETTIKETVMPDYITELVHETGLNMLLDTSHAFVSSYQLGMDIYEYLEQLPLEKVREIHFSGSFFDKTKGFLDVHGIMRDDDYEVARFLATHPKVVNSSCLKIVTLEYGNVNSADKEAIILQMKNLKEIFTEL